MSKPLAILLLVAALAGAMLAGGYIASRDSARTPEQIADELAPLDPPPPATGSSPAGTTPTAAGRPRPTRPNVGVPPAPPGPAPQPGQPLPSRPESIGGTPSAPAAPTFEEVEIPTGEIIELELQSPLSTETAKVEDRVESRITKDVLVGTTIAIKAGTKLLGSVTSVDKGGRFNEPAKLGVRFHTIVMPGATDVPVVIDPLIREGPAQAGDSKKKIAGGAAAGAAVGWMKGGVTGALTGAAVGGGAGTAAKVVEGRKPAELPAGARARVELRAPAAVIVKR